MTDVEFTYQCEILVNPPVSRQWVSIKVFTLPDVLDDRDALASLIAHVRYRDSYASSTFTDAKTIHGPYVLHAITPDTFTAADPALADNEIRTWTELHAVWPPADREAMDREVYARFRRATALYRLPDIRAWAQHDWGEIVGSDGFHEFVVIDRGSGQLALVVASDD
ncbi:hypothetical protein FK535_22765 [Mycolicibacterium sp. 018/SC-01/001]|uniref:hypothetical protein n=1 Tax=Mycolicibacterium sp. 018/SC-01/001 TaxID=2592069 RepID=UPI00118173A6|nr:hypothetical protein [Mycolicibacterium sp. 018/SC-01/001]TRW79338.1 hypothetical protein FK535_22765 [Mycolicibacterium sp. 018/SC-01/001]